MFNLVLVLVDDFGCECVGGGGGPQALGPLREPLIEEAIQPEEGGGHHRVKAMSTNPNRNMPSNYCEWSNGFFDDHEGDVDGDDDDGATFTCICICFCSLELLHRSISSPCIILGLQHQSWL